MARIRTIKPEFFTSEDIVSLTPLSRLFYVSLWCEADREGRLAWSPKTLKRRYLPEDDVDVMTVAQPVIDAGLVVIYEVDGTVYAEIPSFKRHQVINNRESESEIPPLNKGKRVNASDFPARVKDACTRGSGEGRKEGKEGTPAKKEEDSRFAEFWDAWPKSDRKQDRKKCSEKWLAQDLDSVADQILSDIQTKKSLEKWTEAGGRYIEAPLVYINNRRWEDGVMSGFDAPDWSRGAV